jgi:hypothetical protein
METRYALLLPSPHPAPLPCSREEWQDWINGPHHKPCLARERLDDYTVDLGFTGRWTGPAWETPRFFSLSVRHPLRTCEDFQFETYEQARAVSRCVLEECHRRAKKEVTTCL